MFRRHEYTKMLSIEHTYTIGIEVPSTIVINPKDLRDNETKDDKLGDIW